VITLLLHYQEIGLLEQALVVVPTSLISNWEQELSKFAPTLKYYSYYGNKRKKILVIMMLLLLHTVSFVMT